MMSQKQLFVSAAITAVFLFSFFAIQLVPYGNRVCSATTTLECDADAQLACEGGEYSLEPIYSSCINGVCISFWEVWCMDPVGGGTITQYDGDVECRDEFDNDCSSNVN
jgi:hypothetical protein